MMKLLEQYEWKLDRIEGSHHIFEKEGIFKKVVVPVHGKKDLRPGTERTILKDANLLHYWKNRKGGKR